MQHLLQFLYDHSFDKQLYCVVPSASGPLHRSWRAASPQVWELRREGSQVAEQLPRASLLAHLRAQNADLTSFERELSSLIAAHVVVADQLLVAAHDALGSESVRAMLRGQEHFARELKRALTSALPPRLRLVR
jgi:hypothetical protein